MSNPLDDYLLEKNAWWGADFGNALDKGMRSGLQGKALGGAAAKGLVGAGTALAGTAVAAGAVYGAQSLYNAATKARDFRNMLEADPRLQLLHQEDPRRVNQMFSTLRTFNPSFTRDPIVAATYVHQMASNPETAGMTAVEALGHRDKMKAPLTDRMTNAAFGGKEPKDGKGGKGKKNWNR